MENQNAAVIERKLKQIANDIAVIERAYTKAKNEYQAKDAIHKIMFYTIAEHQEEKSWAAKERATYISPEWKRFVEEKTELRTAMNEALTKRNITITEWETMRSCMSSRNTELRFMAGS